MLKSRSKAISVDVWICVSSVITITDGYDGFEDINEHSELNLESQENLALKQGKAVLRFSVT